jgi:hypothetical protein
LRFWSCKNELSAFDYFSGSEKVVWWICPNEHPDYKRNILLSLTCDFRCPKCQQEMDCSYLQDKVNKYLNFLGYNNLKEYSGNLECFNPKTNRRLPYDNEIEIGIIFEVNGKGHYILDSFSKMAAKQNETTPEYEFEYLQWKDAYKKQFAINNDYMFVEIPYWTDNEEEEWKQIIDDAITYRIKELEERGYDA